MRVLTGEKGSRKLSSNVSEVTRPTTARVRKSIFDIIWSRFGIEGYTFLDLFAGTGSMGIEALSRGAEFVQFVDNSPRAIKVVKDNLRALAIDPSSYRVAHSGYQEYLLDNNVQEFDIAFLDPPYSFNNWDKLLEMIPARILVCESSMSVEVNPSWEKVLERKYGTTMVTVLINCNQL